MSSASLIIHQDSADVLDHATKLIRIPGAIYEPRNLARRSGGMSS